MAENFPLDINKEPVNINNYGKPFIANKKNIHFNLAHSGGIVCCIVDNFPVGIDVELISPIDLDIAFNFFSSKECFNLSNLPANEQIKYFYKLWVLKESYIKAEGKGLSISLNSFSFGINNNQISLKNRNSSKWDFALYYINTNAQKYQLGICVHKGRLPKEIIEIPYMWIS